MVMFGRVCCLRGRPYVLTLRVPAYAELFLSQSLYCWRYLDTAVVITKADRAFIIIKLLILHVKFPEPDTGLDN